MDWTDTKRLRVRDLIIIRGENGVETFEVRCHGSKRRHRNRVVRVTEYWTLPYIRAAIADKLPEAFVFLGSSNAALDAHHAAVAACELPHSTLHDWRHTYAVNGLRSGFSATVVAHQLGQTNAYQVWTRYGRFVPNWHDYRLAPTPVESTVPSTGSNLSIS